MAHINNSKYRRRDRKSCNAVSVVKNLLFIYNFVFLISGAAILGVPIWTMLCKFDYVNLLTTSNYVVGIYALAVAGLLAIIAGIIGCCGLYYEHRAVLLCYTFCLVLVFLIEAIVGSFAYLYETQIYDELNSTLTDTFLENYGIDESITLTIDQMQQEYSCCGAVRFEDWLESAWYKNGDNNILRAVGRRLVPDSCCVSFSDECGKSDHPNNIPYTGCIYTMSDELRDHLALIGAIAVGISLIQIIGMLLSCCFYIKLKDPDD